MILKIKTRIGKLRDSFFAWANRHPKLINNLLWVNFFYFYNCYIKFDKEDINLKKRHSCLLQEVNYYQINTERIKRVTDLLEDKKSKYIFQGMVKFRHTLDRNNYPYHVIKEQQYFFSGLRLKKDEVFIDCGAFTGDTLDVFCKHCPIYKKIIAFEPDTKNFKALQNKHGNKPDIILFKTGVSDSDGEVSFLENGGTTSKIYEHKNATKIPVRSIDSVLRELGAGERKVTFIKMDVEGAELRALKGASETILREKPKLAISIYHKKEDMIEIAEYIHDLVPEYKLYVRQYDFVFETVLYARI